MKRKFYGKQAVIIQMIFLFVEGVLIVGSFTNVFSQKLVALLWLFFPNLRALREKKQEVSLTDALLEVGICLVAVAVSVYNR